MRSTALAAIAASATLALPAVASARILVAPPILGQGLGPARDVIDETIAKQLLEGRIRRGEADEFLLVKLKECKNSMSCLSTVAKPAGASHVLHVILARRGDKVLTQLTLLDVDSAKPVTTERAKSGLGLDLIEGAIGKAMNKIVEAARATPEFGDGGGPLALSEREARAPTVSVAAVSTTPTLSTPPVAKVTTPPPTDDDPDAAAPSPGRLPDDPLALGSIEPPVVEAKVPTVRGTNYVAFGIEAVGTSAMLAGGVAFILSGLDVQKRDDTPQTEVAERQRLREAAIQKQTVGGILLVSGAAVVGLGVLFHVTGVGAAEIPIAGGETAPGGATVGLGLDGLSLTW
jgi:hypothetical protein